MVTRFLEREPWAVRFVLPVLALLLARYGLSQTDLDTILQAVVDVVGIVLAVVAYFKGGRARTVPLDAAGQVVPPKVP